mgnify:CR=1 FL=1
MPLMVRKALSYKEEKDIDDKIKYLEDVRDEVEVQQGVKHEAKDSKAIENKLNSLKKIKEAQGVSQVEGRERLKVEKESEQLMDRIRQKWGGKIPSYNEYWMRPKEGGIKYLRLVDKIYSLNKDREYHALVTRWKTLQRMLDPTDPHASNTLKFFPH